MNGVKGRTLDMTSGRILPLMLQFAIPVMFGHLFQNVYNLVDMTVAGYAIGDHAIAAVSPSSALITLINATAMGFNSGNTIQISQAFGAKDEGQARRCFAGAAQLCLVLAVLATAVLLLTVEPLLRIVCAFIFVQTIVMVYRMSLSSMSCKVIPIVGTGIGLGLRFFSAWVLAPLLGFLGICFAEPLSWVVSGAVMAAAYFCVMRRKREQLQKV